MREGKAAELAAAAHVRRRDPQQDGQRGRVLCEAHAHGAAEQRGPAVWRWREGTAARRVLRAPRTEYRKLAKGTAAAWTRLSCL